MSRSIVEPEKVLDERVDAVSLATTFTGLSKTIATDTSEPVWQIKRVTVQDDVVTEYADNGNFTQVWDDRYDLFSPITFINTTSILTDGTNDFVSIGNVPELSFSHTDPYSISGWFRTEKSAEGVIFSKQAGGNNAGYRLSCQAGQIRFHISGGAAGDRIEARTFVDTYGDSFWHHVLVTYDGSTNASGVAIWVDGASIFTTLNADTLVSTSVNAQAAQICGRNSTSNIFEGFLDEISVWNRVLTPSEVGDVYNLGAPTNLLDLSSSSDLVGWWSFDDAIFPSVPDQTTSSNDGIMFNMLSSSLVGETP